MVQCNVLGKYYDDNGNDNDDNDDHDDDNDNHDDGGKTTYCRL